MNLRYVQNMNALSNGTPDDLKAFQLLSEVADERPVSQRELAKRLGIALGLVNSYLKNFVTKGYIRIKNYPQNRYAYLLTPNGIAEKARLAYQHVNYFTSLYTVTRQDYLTLFRELAARGVTQVVFCGVDEVAEIAWLSLQEAGLTLAEVVDENCSGSSFMGRQVVSFKRICLTGERRVVITSLKRADQLKAQLSDMGVREEMILFPGKRGDLHVESKTKRVNVREAAR
jgi:DNA-binding MarR family transcriptional regulator